MMSEFANTKCAKFATIWTEFNMETFYLGIFSGLWMIAFHYAMHKTQHQVQLIAFVPLAISIAVYAMSLD